MFEGWQRADVISALALLVSALAFVVSLFSMRFTAIQTRLAKSKARDEAATKEPAVEPYLVAMPELEPGWFLLTLHIRNRLDVAIVCEILRVRAPRGAAIASLKDSKDSLRGWTQPTSEAMATEINLGCKIARAGACALVNQRTEPHDLASVFMLVLISSTSASKAPQDLEVSLKVRRSSERASFAEIMVVTKIPTVRTNKDT